MLENATIRLERIMLGIRGEIPEYALKDAVGDTFFDDAARSLAVSITKVVLGKTVRDVTITYPSDWWEAFKDRWFPRLLLRRFPVSRTTESFKASQLYPQLDLPSVMTPLVEYRTTTLTDEAGS